MAHSKAVYKYILKVYYCQINKKIYKSQILKQNIHSTNVIAMQDAIIIAKLFIESPIKKKLLLTYLMQRL